MKKAFSTITSLVLLSIAATAAPVTPTWEYPSCQPWYEWDQKGSVVYGDCNNDGILDYLTSTNNRTTVAKGDNWWWSTKLNVGDAANFRFGSMAWLDYNNDGYLDFIIAAASDGANTRDKSIIQLYKNNGNETFTKDDTNTAVFAGVAAWTGDNKDYTHNHFAVADYNNDGWNDLVVNGRGLHDGTRHMVLYLNEKGTFKKIENTFKAIDGSTVWAADFNNDGNIDVAVSGYHSNAFATLIYWGRGDGTFAETHLNYGLENGTTFAIDVNNDGYQDLIIAGNGQINNEWTNALFYVKNNGDGTFANPVINPGIADAGIKDFQGALVPGDLNNDGYMDFAFHTSWTENASVYTWIVLNNGNETFTALPADKNSGTRDGGIALFNQNGDGKLDLHVYGWGDVADKNPYQDENPENRNWFNNFMVNTTAVNDYTTPSVPSNVKYAQNGNNVILSWDAATDAISPVRYNIYAKNKTTGKIFTLAPANIETGALKYINHGTLLTTTSWIFRGMSAANYEFGVQAVNNGYIAGAFAVATEGEEIPPVNGKTFNVGKWTLSINTLLEATLSHDGRVILNANKAAWGNGTSLTSFANLSGVTITSAPVNDELGSATEVSISGRDAQGNTYTHRYCLYDSENFVTTDITVTAANGTVAYNYMSPVTTNGSATMPDASDNVALFVPFDNDDFVSYSISSFGSTHPESYEVTTLFNKNTRNAIVLGSITHDHWKTAINVSTSGNNTISSICAFGGASSYQTRDMLPHGKVKGTSVQSPRIMVGCFDDWRTGMETYGKLCNTIAPMWAWNAPKPFVWNSWNVFASNVTYDNVNTASSYIASDLPNFCDEDGVAYICIDSFWDNLTASELRRFAARCKERGQKAGIYHTPFTCWAVDDSGYIWGTPYGSSYENSEIVLKDYDGNVVRYRKGSNAYGNGVPIDPTHPGTRQYLEARLQQFIDWGYEHVKLDFLSHGAVQGNFYNPEITTGIEAYNYGMQMIKDFVGDKMHINLSICPLFPSQYGHSRRISCDAWEKISDTKYVLNSTTYGWWLNECYPYNDADGARLYNGNSANEAANRCRMTSSIVTGYIMACEDMGNSNAQQRAQTFLNDALINNAIRSIKYSFRPVEPADGTGCAEQYVYNDGENIYIAVYNFSTAAKKTIDYERFGLEKGAKYEFHELWSKEKITCEGDSYTTTRIKNNDVHLYEVKKIDPSAVESVWENNSAAYYDAAAGAICLTQGEAVQAAIYNTTGACVMQAGNHSELNVQALATGVYIYVGQSAEGKVIKCKFAIQK